MTDPAENKPTSVELLIPTTLARWQQCFAPGARSRWVYQLLVDEINDNTANVTRDVRQDDLQHSTEPVLVICAELKKEPFVAPNTCRDGIPTAVPSPSLVG